MSTDHNRFANPKEATAELVESYNAWSEIITSRGLEACYAVIAANWAVYGNATKILENRWSFRSIVTIFIVLGINLFFTFIVSEFLRARCSYAEESSTRWKKEYDASLNTKTHWPYNRKIDYIAFGLRYLKAIGPILACVFFLLSLFSKTRP